MRIIVTVPSAPWPVTKGTDRLIMNLLEGLSVRHRVTLVTMALSEEELAGLGEIERDGISVNGLLAPHRRGRTGKFVYKMKNVLESAFSGVPQDVSYAAPPVFLRGIADAADEIDADLILASYWHMYRLPAYTGDRRLALVTHDLNYISNRERRRIPSGILSGKRGSAGLERIEMEAYDRYDTILTVTPSDAQILAKDLGDRGKTILPLPLALDLSVFKPDSFRRVRNRILLLGTFHSDFNRDALRYFTGEVFPAVRQKIPDTVLEVVGHGADAGLRQSAGPDIEFTGGVDDIIPHLGRCSLMVLPLRFSGGVRIRMMEAAAMGTPVVSTPPGVAGMGLEAGAEYIEARSAEEMAGEILRLLENPGEAERIGRTARKWAEKTISMETYPDRLDAMLERITKR